LHLVPLERNNTGKNEAISMDNSRTQYLDRVAHLEKENERLRKNNETLKILNDKWLEEVKWRQELLDDERALNATRSRRYDELLKHRERIR
jgi:hypothetical protein